MNERALALAGLLQATRQVRRLATTGEIEREPFAACIDSLFRMDAPDVEAVYGGASRLEPGLRLLHDTAQGGAQRDPETTRVAATVLHIERRYSRNAAMMSVVRAGILEIDRQRPDGDGTEATILARLGELYATTISGLRPRVLVRGHPAYLGQPGVATEIRAGLLAALRSAVLWRQLGGSYWDLLLRRKAIADAARNWLGRP